LAFRCAVVPPKVPPRKTTQTTLVSLQNFSFVGPVSHQYRYKFLKFCAPRLPLGGRPPLSQFAQETLSDVELPQRMIFSFFQIKAVPSSSGHFPPPFLRDPPRLSEPNLLLLPKHLIQFFCLSPASFPLDVLVPRLRTSTMLVSVSSSFLQMPFLPFRASHYLSFSFLKLPTFHAVSLPSMTLFHDGQHTQVANCLVLLPLPPALARLPQLAFFRESPLSIPHPLLVSLLCREAQDTFNRLFLFSLF